ncbi:unnamed protein product [Brachionus calyciflorus]|uniref:Non-specific serine/threonine protein kinase n=1 Tax=Brachionus calyciflorus TaxID=104777 RepID=A0A813M4W5_9BILA|nr:unnamed protein product [Brachionus calyciflorus]
MEAQSSTSFSIDYSHQTFQSWIDQLVDSNASEDQKLKSVQDLSLNLELMQTLPTYSQLIEDAMHKFVRLLTETEPQFLVESSVHQLRKKILEILQRTHPFLNLTQAQFEKRLTLIREVLHVIYQLLEKENEDNVILCLKIIIEFYKYLKNVVSISEVQKYFNFVKNMYQDLAQNFHLIFQYKPQIKVKDLNELNVTQILNESYSSFQIQTEKYNQKDNQIFHLIPRGVKSLKVLVELPLNSVTMYQNHKAYLTQDISDLLVLISNIIVLKPSEEQRHNVDLKEVIADFVTAQVRALSFIAYFKNHQDYLKNNVDLFVNGILELFKICPAELVSVRKDLLAISRHIISEHKLKFLPYLSDLFDESLFCSSGYTAAESLKSSACSVVSDLVHHVRKELSYQDLCKAIQYFSKGIHDPLLNINLQHMCCKVLLSLTETIRAKENARELIQKLLEVFVLKLKSMAKYQVPNILNPNNPLASNSTTILDDKPNEKKSLVTFIQSQSQNDDNNKQKSKQSDMSELDIRSTLRLIIMTCRSLTLVLLDTKSSNQYDIILSQKNLQPTEIKIYIQLLKNSLQTLLIYSSNKSNTQKEEKEIIEGLGLIYTYLNAANQKLIFEQTINQIINLTFKYSNLTILTSYFLATPATSCTFSTILIENLLDKLDLMGDSSTEHSNLYLKLFKLVFGSVSVFPIENEKMLKPHLHSIVTRSLDLALKSKEPHNYFLLLRALFRSIGGGNHDLLYQEFLPLLPILLQSLNELQTGVHKQHLKDLFVELCLTVPVRLSSLLPYLPMLMDPLVSALNGSTTLVSQGLRTLELCVDNLQPDFLYEHIQPVRQDLIQGLWKQLRSSNETIALASYRVLGKLGGSNRKMILQAQNLNNSTCNLDGFKIQAEFIGYQNNLVDIEIEQVLNSCLNCLKLNASQSNVNDLAFYKLQAFNFVSSFILSLIKIDDDVNYQNVFLNYIPINQPQFTQYILKTQKLNNEKLRSQVCKSFECLLYSSSLKDEHKKVLPLIDSITLHLTMTSLSHYTNQNEQKIQQLIQSINVFSNTAESTEVNYKHLKNESYLDFMILIDALFNVLCNDDSEYWPLVQRVVSIIIETSDIINGQSQLMNYQEDTHDKYLRSQLANQAMFEYLADKISQLCYERSWYAKKAGCLIMNLFVNKMPLIWLLQQSFLFVKSIMFILVSVTGEISSGAIDVAKETLDNLVKSCFIKLNFSQQNEQSNLAVQLIELQQKTLNDVLKELVKQITSSSTYVRKESIKLITQISELQSKTVYNLVQSFQDILNETVAPRKHLKLKHYSYQSQIGILESLEFCSSTQPQLFTLQLTNQDHQNIYTEITSICEQDDASLLKLTCYKSLNDMLPIRKATLNCLASFYHLLDQREVILGILHKSLENSSQEIQETSFNCLKKYTKNTESYSNHLRQTQPNTTQETHRPIIQIAADYLRDYLHPLTDYTYLKKNVVKHLSYITKLYPTILNDKFSEYLLSHLKRWLEDLLQILKENFENPTATPKPMQNEIELCSNIISLLSELQSAPVKLVETSIPLVLKFEKTFGLEISGKFREPLGEFLKRFPFETLKYLLNADRIKDMYCFRFIVYLIKKHTVQFGHIFKTEPNRLVQMLNESQTLLINGLNQQNFDFINKSNQILFLTIFIFYRLTKIESNSAWLQSQNQLIEALLKIWCDDKFHEKHSQIDTLHYIYWKEPIYMLKILLKFHQIHIELHKSGQSLYPLASNIELLFKLLISFQHKSLNQYEFFRNYLTNKVAKEYSNEIKREIFFTFVQKFTETNDPIYTQKLKSSILQQILIPCFILSFESNEHVSLIGGPPNPDTDSQDNIISVFINKVVDPDQPYAYSDSVRIFLLQLSSLFVQHAHDYIHDVNNKKQGNKLRRLMTFAWPSLLAKTCVDPFNKYHGLLLLSHIISKFAIHKRIVFQVFHSLLKAYAPEAKLVVRQALEILTPTFPTRSEDGYVTLASWTKKILIEENHSIPQLSHLIYIIVKYFKVFYFIRHTLINQLIVAFQKVGLSQNSTNENKLLVIDLCETILKWEAQRKLDSEDLNFDPNLKLKHPDLLKPFDKHICDCIMNFFVRFSCQMSTVSQEGSQNTNLNEQLARKCLNLFQMAIQNDLLNNFDLKLEILDKLLTSLESTFSQNPLVTNILGASQTSQTSQINLNQIYTCLEILLILVENSSKSKIQLILKSLHRGLQYCITNTNTKIIKLTSSIIEKLMINLPSESFNNISVEAEPSSDPIHTLFGQPDGILCRMILESLSYYEKMSLINPSETTSLNLSIDILTNCLCLIKSASINNAQYIDRLMGPIMKILQKLYRDHLNSINSIGQCLSSADGANVIQAPNSVQVYSFTELIIQVIDLVKNRVGVMSIEMRKMFINQILVSLIEKSIDLRLIKYLVKLINDWIKMSHVNNVLLNQIPTMKEKLVLLQKLTLVMDKKFSDNSDIQKIYLDTISFVYQNEAYLTQQEFKIKLEQAFLLGMKSTHVDMRQIFYDLFNKNFQSNDLFERLCFVIITQNWELFGSYYWIRQCIQLTLGSCYNMNFMTKLNPKFMSLSEAQSMILTPESTHDVLMEQIELEESLLIAPLNLDMDYNKNIILENNVEKLLQIEANLTKRIKKINLSFLIDPICHLCHLNQDLAHSVWTQIFPKFFSLFTEKQRVNLFNELTPFFASGIHCIQKSTQMSVLNTFCESLCQISQYNLNLNQILKPSLLTYLAKNHNLWHRCILTLESQYINDTNLENFQGLANLLGLLKEEDLKTGLWLAKKSQNDTTRLALVYEQQGLYLQAQKLFEELISKNVDSYLNEYLNKEEDIHEFNLWEDKWVKCCKELNQWAELNEYISTKDNDLSLTLECAWKSQSDWQLMKTCLITQKETNIPKDQVWKWFLYQGYYLVCNPDDLHQLMLQNQSVFSLSAAIESKVEKCMLSALKEWRRLPRLITPAHMSLLQAAQQIIELQEAFQIQQNLNSNVLNQTQALQETKGIIKTWRARLPLINDDVSYWNDIFQWRQFHYEAFTKYFEKQPTNSSQAMLGVHAVAQGIVNFGKIARKQHLYDLCLETLNKIHKKQSVPIIDCFLKVKQEIKCYINTYEYLSPKQSKEILDLIEATNLRFFTKENVAELISLKAQFLQLNNKFDDANHLYSFSIYLNDSSPKLWGAWSDYLTQAFVDVTSRQAYSTRPLEAAESALIGLLNAAKHSGGEAKTRKYIAKIFWLLSYDNEKKELFNQFEQYALPTIPVQNWIQWIPQLITLLLKNDDNGKYLYGLMNQIIRQYPLAVYYPLRTLYFKIKQDEHADKIKQQILAQQKGETDVKEKSNSSVESLVRGAATLMHVQREMHPLLFNTLEGLIDQLLLLKYNWYEELLRNFKQTLNYVYTYFYEANLNKKSDFVETIDPFSIMWFKKIHKFYIDIQYFQLPNRLNSQQNSPSIGSPSGPSTQSQTSAQNPRLRGLIAILNDPNHQITRQKFQQDFPYTQTNPSQQINIKLFIDKIKNWIKLLQLHVDLSVPKKSILDEKFKLVTQFCSNTADIELPGEYLVPRSTNYYVKISRFLPVYETIEKYQTFSRRIYIRGHNGKVYPFLIVNESNHFYDSRKEEHGLQLFRMMNTYLNKQKETSCRSLNFITPRIVSLSFDFRLIEDEPSAISLLDIVKPDLREKSIETYFTQRNFITKPEIYKSISNQIIRKNLMKSWAMKKYSDATDYFNFRKLFTQQLSLYNISEFILGLTSLKPDQFYISQNSGLCQTIRYKFDLNENMNNRLTPFRLTPNLVEFIQPSGVYGQMSASMTALARCLNEPHYGFIWILRTILKDDVLNVMLRKKQEDLIKNVNSQANLSYEIEQENIINLVNKLVASIEIRLKECENLDNGKNYVLNELIPKAINLENLSETDPSWFPWF